MWPKVVAIEGGTERGEENRRHDLNAVVASVQPFRPDGDPVIAKHGDVRGSVVGPFLVNSATHTIIQCLRVLTIL